jgi:predicted nucleic acid-binding protein
MIGRTATGHQRHRLTIAAAVSTPAHLMILVDTNVILRIIQIGHPHRQAALDAIERLTLRDSERFVIAPQILYELYVVCSRPQSSNGLGMTAEQALWEIVSARTIFSPLPDAAEVYSIWENLVTKHRVEGKRAHDVRLAAFMTHHHILKILTFDDADFRGFTEIEAVNPFDVLGIPRR